MRKRRANICGLLCLLLFAAGSCSRDPLPGTRPEPRLSAHDLSGARALEEVREFVRIAPRPSGSEGAAQAAAHIEQRLRVHGLSPSRDVFTDPTPNGRVTFRNILAHLRAAPLARTASAPMIVLASHYDTKAGISHEFTGANDSGSSTGLLLELARVCATHSTRSVDLLFAFLDGEECLVQYGARDGLHGSRRLAKRLSEDPRQSVRAVIVLDMVGDRDLTITLPSNSDPELLRIVLKAAHMTGHRKRFALWPRAILDDHVPFLNRGIPAIDIIDFEYGSRPGANDHWHTTGDSMDKLSADSLEVVGRTVIEAINLIAQP